MTTIEAVPKSSTNKAHAKAKPLKPMISNGSSGAGYGSVTQLRAQSIQLQAAESIYYKQIKNYQSM